MAGFYVQCGPLRVQGRPSHPFTRVHIRPGFQQEGGTCGVFVAGGQVQGRLTVVGPRACVRACLKQHPDNLGVRVALGRQV